MFLSFSQLDFFFPIYSASKSLSCIKVSFTDTYQLYGTEQSNI